MHPDEKNIAIVLILALNIMFTSAFTEVRNFDLACIIDMDGNLLYTALDDNTALIPKAILSLLSLTSH